MKSLYIHIPFCEQKCFYCSFAVTIGQAHKADQYLACLAKGMEPHAQERIGTIYVGGGTPTLMTADQLRILCGLIRKYFHFAVDAEWTVEANPEHLTREKLDVMRREGVNRISLGVQSLRQDHLEYLGRNHDARSVQEAYARIREAGYDNVNVDMMFSLPGQTTHDVRRDLEAILKLQSDHVSLYALTIEEHSRFYARHIALGGDDDQARNYELVCEMLQDRGFEQYEISNFAKPGRISYHNVNYWEGGQYIGLGVGAHAYLGATRSWNVPTLREYLVRSEQGLSTIAGSEDLAPYDQMMECVLFGLRMNRGVALDEIGKRYDRQLTEEQRTKIDEFVRAGFLIWDQDLLKASAKGRLVLDELCAQLI